MGLPARAGKGGSKVGGCTEASRVQHQFEHLSRALLPQRTPERCGTCRRHVERLQVLRSSAEWRRWSESDKANWSEQKRQRWAEELWRGQHRRRLERIRWDGLGQAGRCTEGLGVWLSSSAAWLPGYKPGQQWDARCCAGWHSGCSGRRSGKRQRRSASGGASSDGAAAASSTTSGGRSRTGPTVAREAALLLAAARCCCSCCGCSQPRGPHSRGHPLVPCRDLDETQPPSPHAARRGSIFAGGHRAGGRSDFLGYYRLLELDGRPQASVSLAEIKQAFRRQALKWHPDKHEVGCASS